MTSRIDPALIPPDPDLAFESDLWAQGISLVAGLDEAGRGAWAGPVAAAAVIFPSDPIILSELNGVRDSKQLTPSEREELRLLIHQKALVYAVGLSEPEMIDELGIVMATRLAMQVAIEKLEFPPAHLLIDALFLPDCPIPQTALIKGDQRSLSIAAASIMAKTARDELMIDLDHRYEGYGFAAHKGYGTRQHEQALNKQGPCPQHRMSFAPLKQFEPNSHRLDMLDEGSLIPSFLKPH